MHNMGMLMSLSESAVNTRSRLAEPLPEAPCFPHRSPDSELMANKVTLSHRDDNIFRMLMDKAEAGERFASGMVLSDYFALLTPWACSGHSEETHCRKGKQP